jgi:hypothetical protein
MPARRNGRPVALDGVDVAQLLHESGVMELDRAYDSDSIMVLASAAGRDTDGLALDVMRNASIVGVTGDEMAYLVWQSKHLQRSRSGVRSPLFFWCCSAAQRQRKGGAVFDFMHRVHSWGHQGEGIGGTENVLSRHDGGGNRTGVLNGGRMVMFPGKIAATDTEATS